MYDNFEVVDCWTNRAVHCVYQALILAISTRHADAVDIKFLVDGQPVWISLPQTAWGEYYHRTGKIMTDPLAVQIAGHYLKLAIEGGQNGDREMHTLTVADTLQHLEALLQEERAGAVSA